MPCVTVTRIHRIPAKFKQTTEGQKSAKIGQKSAKNSHKCAIGKGRVKALRNLSTLHIGAAPLPTPTKGNILLHVTET